ncbi:MAG: C10 family peptidase, partial [Planctomycetota bacterium]
MKRRSAIHRNQSSCKLTGSVTLSFLALLLFWPAELWAKPVTGGQAQKAVRGWLKVSPKPLGTALGKQIARVDTFTNDEGEPVYYVVYLDPSGFVIVPADDLVEPVVAFVAKGAYDPSDDSPLGAMVSRDLPARVAAARILQSGGPGSAQTLSPDRRETLQKAGAKAKDKWADLQAYDDTVGVTGLSGISDVRVPPLTQSTWGQTTVGDYIGGITCYNYYTPSNYPCGCVATAMSQLIRYHEYPSSGPSGSYVWSNMPLQPDDGITLPERQAIGHLCYDAAESVETDYGPVGSSASLHDASHAVKDTFGYTDSVHGYKNYSELGSALINMILPNLDASHPVLLGIHSSGAHAVVCDGYGYDASTRYHHLNMGWSGRDNAWYNLPTIVCPETDFSYSIVDTCVYNIFTSGSGEIISGRITDPEGLPISGVAVTAGGGTYNDITDAEGIYALAKVTSGAGYTVSASKGKWNFSNQMVTAGTSLQDSTTCGNRWGIDFSGTISAGFIELDKETYAVPESISIRVVDSDLQGHGTQNVVLMICGGDHETVTLTENPPGTGVFKGSIPTAVGATVVEDGTIQVLGSKVVTGVYEDADDGTGSPATSRDSATLAAQATSIYTTNFTGGLPAGWSTVDGGTSSHTWYATSEWGSRTSPYWTGTFMIADSDLAGYQVMDEELISCGIDCSAYENVTLKFKHWFYWWISGWDEICDVDVRVDGGQWQNVQRYQGQDADGLVELPLSPFGADGNPNVQIRWHYHNAYFEYWWGIDDVEITGLAQPELILGDFEPDCDVDFHDFAVLALAWRSGEGDGNWNPACDISAPKDGLIDEWDLDVLTENWLT